jgi:hypothetical protein
MVYNSIYDFCRVKAHGSARKNGLNLPARVEWLINFLTTHNLNYHLDSFSLGDTVNLYHNIILKGDGPLWVVAHHDIVNPDADNANDNSASVINAIALKMLVPSVNIALLDGEEIGGIGSNHLAKQMKDGKWGDVEWVLNLELTGKGGKYFFIGDYTGPLHDHIKSLYNCPVSSTPFNDSVIFRRNGIDSCVINPLPRQLNESVEILNENILLDWNYLYNCHSLKDSLDTISVDDMKVFVEEVLVNIVKR